MVESAVISPKDDAGAGVIFVLKSRGSWWHCGYHLTTAIVGAPLLSLPLAMALLGWIGGAICLTAAGLVTFYSYNLMSIVLEHHAELGRRQLLYRDMANDILGPGWGRYFIGPLQLLICFGAVISLVIVGGQGIQFVYVVARPNGGMQLYQFIIIYGILILIFAQIPSFHATRHINFVALLLVLTYAACATVGSVYIGYSKQAAKRDYSITGVGVNRVFGYFNGISIMATIYGNGIIPEIQATIAPPVTGKMFKGLLLSYCVVISTYFSVAISGYWSFGNQAQGTILSNFILNGAPLVPKWFIIITSIFVILQIFPGALIYLQPINVVLENRFCDLKKGELSSRNVVSRLVSRSLMVFFATLLAAMLPFFGDFMALIGSFGFIPLDFILPMVFYNITFKSSVKGFVYWVNAIIAAVFTAVASIGIVASVRQIVLDSGTYRLFANI